MEGQQRIWGKTDKSQVLADQVSMLGDEQTTNYYEIMAPCHVLLTSYMHPVKQGTDRTYLYLHVHVRLRRPLNTKSCHFTPRIGWWTYQLQRPIARRGGTPGSTAEAGGG